MSWTVWNGTGPGMFCGGAREGVAGEVGKASNVKASKKGHITGGVISVRYSVHSNIVNTEVGMCGFPVLPVVYFGFPMGTVPPLLLAHLVWVE